MTSTNVAKKKKRKEKRISNKTQILDQINLTKRCKDNSITKYFHNDELRDVLQPFNKKKFLKTFHSNISSLLLYY